MPEGTKCNCRCSQPEDSYGVLSILTALGKDYIFEKNDVKDICTRIVATIRNRDSIEDKKNALKALNLFCSALSIEFERSQIKEDHINFFNDGLDRIHKMIAAQ